MPNKRAPKKTPKSKRIIGSKVSLSEMVRRHLLRERTTAVKLAAKAGLNKSILSKILSGKQGTLMPDSVEKLANAMGVHWSKLYSAIRVTKSGIVDKSEIETCIDRSKSLSHNIQ